MQNRMMSLDASLGHTDANCAHVTFPDMSVAQAAGSACQRRRAARETKLGSV